MKFFTIKNIGLLLLLVGVLAFPVGINQSYAQQNGLSVTDAPNQPPTAPTVTASAAQGASGTIDFSGIMDDSDSFEELNILFALQVSGATNPAPNLGDQVDFNASDVTSSFATAVLVNTNMVRFTVDDDAVAGTYTLAYIVTDSGNLESTGTVIFTIVDTPTNPAAPTATDIVMDVLLRGDAIIPFGANIMDTETEFDELDITFSYDRPGDETGAISITSGATRAVDLEGVVTFDVTDENVGLSEDSGRRDLNVGRTVVLTYTVSDGEFTSTGTVTLTIVAALIVPLDPALGLDDFTINVPRSSLPTHTEIFDDAAYVNLINPRVTFGITGPDTTEVVLGITSPGSAEGTATFIVTGSYDTLYEATLTYTPAPNFDGTETFTYSGTTDRGTATGVITFIVAASPNTPPTIPSLTVTTAQNAENTIVFSGITDDSDMMFSDFRSVEFFLTRSGGGNPASNLSTQVVFNSADVDSANTDDSRLLVTSETLRFTVNDDATRGTYNLEYTVTDSDGGATTGVVTFTITDPTDGTLDDRTFTIPMGSMFERTFDNTEYLDLLNYDDTFNGNTDGPGSVSLSIEAIGSEGGAATIRVIFSPSFGPILTYTPTAEFSGTETFIYTGIQDGVTATGTFTFIVVAAANTAPLTPDIEVSAAQGAADEIPFSSITDDSDSFEQLDIEFALTPASGVTNPAPNLSAQVAFNTADSTFIDSATRLSVNTDPVKFSVLSAGTVGIYTLVYTVTDSDGAESTGNLIFTITQSAPVESCETSLSGGINFGTLRVGATSETSTPISISNDGNVPARSLIAGANWVSDSDGMEVMNAGQTRYSLTEGDTYGIRTSFTTTPVNVGDEIAVSESLDIYLQLLIDLMDNAFRGATTQTMTVTSSCSVSP